MSFLLDDRRGAGALDSRTPVRYPAVVDRRSELEQMRRSIAMLRPEANAMSREQALALLAETAELQARLERLRAGLSSLLDEA